MREQPKEPHINIDIVLSLLTAWYTDTTATNQQAGNEPRREQMPTAKNKPQEVEYP